jgi:methyl-accepting chemotaxis protein
VPSAELADMSVAFQRIRINLRDAMEAETPAERQQSIDTIAKLR